MEDKSNFKEELNRIYSKPQALRNFWNSKLTYNTPLAYMLESYNTNPKEFSELFPLKVGDIVDSLPIDTDEKEALIMICYNELTPRGYALRRLLTR